MGQSGLILELRVRLDDPHPMGQSWGGGYGGQTWVLGSRFARPCVARRAGAVAPVWVGRVSHRSGESWRSEGQGCSHPGPAQRAKVRDSQGLSVLLQLSGSSVW